MRSLLLLVATTLLGCSNQFVDLDNTVFACSTDDDCTVDRVCLSAQCVDADDAPLPAYGILIKDHSAGESCDGPSPGADLFSVALADPNGRIVALGQPVPGGRGFLIDGDSTPFTNATRWNERLKTEADAQRCPDFVTGEVVSLGCGGSVFMTFRDAPWLSGTINEAVAITDQHRLLVSEYGTQCQLDPPQPLPELIDAYDVLVCPPSEFEPGDSGWDVTEANCIPAAEFATGFTSIDMDFDI